jgi:hypothetical protein
MPLSPAPSPIKSVVKAADQATTSTHTTLRDVTDLVFPVVANETRYFEFVLYQYSGASTTGLTLNVTGPAGSAGRWGAYVSDSSYFPVAGSRALQGTSIIFASAVGSAGAPGMVIITGVCRNGATPGNIQLQFAAEVDAVTTIMADSYGKSWT